MPTVNTDQNPNPPSATPQPDAVAQAAALHLAQARLRRRLDHELGVAHGIGWDDYMLLARLAERQDAPQARSDWADALGEPPSAVLRRVLTLHKLGLVERLPAPAAPAKANAGGLDRVRLRPPARGLLHSARDTVRWQLDELRRTEPALAPWLGTAA
jgi:DNA-binding MarR family transcriptional regulator